MNVVLGSPEQRQIQHALDRIGRHRQAVGDAARDLGGAGQAPATDGRARGLGNARAAFLHAAASGGKTAIIVDLCLHIAAGIEYRGRRVTRQPVVYVAL